MIYYDRIDVSEGTNVNKTSESKECNIVTIGARVSLLVFF